MSSVGEVSGTRGLGRRLLSSVWILRPAKWLSLSSTFPYHSRNLSRVERSIPSHDADDIGTRHQVTGAKAAWCPHRYPGGVHTLIAWGGAKNDLIVAVMLPFTNLRNDLVEITDFSLRAVFL